MRSGRLYGRQTLERPICVVASSSSPYEADYPTPSASSYGSSGNGTGNNKQSRGRPSLEGMAATYPTPVSSRRSGRNTKTDKAGRVLEEEDKRTTHVRGSLTLNGQVTEMYATPMRGGEEKGPAYPRGNPTLQGQVRMWPTACTTDAKDSARGTTTTGIMNPGTSLTDAIRSSGLDGPPPSAMKKAGADTTVLVPEFVEALMGFPEGWTLVEGEPVWLAWVTLLCRNKRLWPWRN